VVYGLANGTLEIGRCGGGSPGAESWGARVRDERGVLTARFDTRFRVVELIASPASSNALAGHHPLAHPLDELLVLHRLARDGGFLARGRLETCDGRQTLVLGGDDSRVAVRTGRAGVRAFSTPWGRTPAPRSGRLDAVHAPRRGGPPGALRLDPACAPAALLPDVVAPIHCHELAVRAASAVEQVAAQVPVFALDLPEADPIVPFAWGRREAAFGFTAPVAP
jgi:hypothetical protein